MSVYFTDRDLGRRFPEALSAAGIDVEPHHRHFRHDTADDVWIRETARRGWVALSRDRRIRYKPNEQAAVIESNARLIVLVGRTTTDALANNFINSADRVERFLDRHPPPFIAKLYRPSAADLEEDASTPGHVELWLDSAS